MKTKSTIVIFLLTVFSLMVPRYTSANFGANGIHDPSSIVKLNGVYHIYGTGNQITHLTSTDLLYWTAAPPVFATGTYPSWITTYVPGFAGNFWAPEIVEVKGVFYLYYACSTGGNVAAIGLATSTDLTTWSDKGVVINSTSTDSYSAVDPAMFVDATGNWWLTSGSHFSGIYITQLDAATGKRTAASVNTNIGGNTSSEHAASYITFENGYYYLFYNVGVCCNSVNSTSSIKVGRSTSPTGPYIDKNNIALKGAGGGTTVLSTSGKYIGPAQFGLYKESGRNIVTTHYYDGTSSGAPKLDQARLTYGTDGWPLISRDILPNARYRIKSKNSGLAWQAQGCTGIAGQKLVQAIPSFTDICQQWELTSVGDGFYKIRNLKTGTNEQVVDLPFCATNNGTLLGTWDWFNNDCQKFKIEQLADGTYVFSTLGNPNRVFEVPGCSTTSGTQLALFDYNGFNCQKWEIELVNTPAAPIAQVATNITANSFTANWSAVPGATGYQLDVSASSNFSSLITGYNNLSVTGTSYDITGRFANAGYFYRIRSVKDGEFSLNSNVASLYTAGSVDNGMHDPSSIVKEGNTYYSYGTGYSNSDGSIVPFTISSTNDLFKWTRGSKPVFAPGTWPAWISTMVPNFAGIFWAPELIFLNGKYHLYYSVSAFGSSTSAIGLATTPTLDQNSPDYKWTDQGVVVSSNAATQANAIDASVLKDSDGRLWLSYGSFSAGLVLVELDAATGLKKAGATTKTVAGGSGSAWEAPYLMQEGNYYYLFANRQYCCALLNSTYYMVVGRSTNINGPYVDKNGTSLTVTSSGTVVGTPVLETAGKFVGPGHIGLLRDNGRNIISTHYYDATSNGYPRIDISTLKFSSDGWPIITRDVLPEGRYTITNKNSNLAWETAGCTGAGGQQLVQNTPNQNALCQQWDLTPVGEGFYRLKNANGGANNQVVDAPFCNTSAGTLLGTWDWLDNDCQKYKIDMLANGSYVFSPYLNGGVVIEVPGGSSAPNTQLGFLPFNEFSAQQWSIDSARFTPVAINSDSVTAASFRAKWNAVPNATNYRVDVYTTANTSPVEPLTIAGWNFEAGNNRASSGVAANIGKTLTTGGGTSTVSYNSAGNAGLTAMATGWNSGNLIKYWEASNISTKGYYSLKVSSKQRSNSTAPRHFKLQYRIGATGAYADVPGTYVTTADNYTSAILSNVQLPAVCNNQPSVYLRWLMITNTSVANNTNANAGGISSTGQSNIDDIIVSGSNSPSYTFIAGYDDTTVTGTSLTIKGLKANTTYYYRIRSNVTGLTSDNSNVVEVKTLCNTAIANAAIVNATCNAGNNGSITVTFSGGLAPYSNSWTGPDTYSSVDPAISSLKAGTYKLITTQSNGCISDTTFKITEPDILVASSKEGTISCNGATTTVTITATGGTAPYAGTGTYTVTAGPYSYTITDSSGCTTTISGTISEPVVLTARATEGTILCNGGTTTITISATGGTAPYTGTGTFTVKAGTYSYTVTDAAGCLSTVSVPIAEPTIITAMATNGNISCNSGTTTILVAAEGGTAPYKGTGTFTKPAGEYTFTVSDLNGCTATTNTVNLIQPSALVATISNSNTQLYFGYAGDQTSTIKVAPSGGTAPYKVSIAMNRPLKCNYINEDGDEKWISDGRTTNAANTDCSGLPAANPVSAADYIALGNAYSINVTLLADADFTITLTDANGCVTTSTTHIDAEDVRCFTTKSGISKITICHQTGSSKNPCVQICVDQSDVNEHIAHGDYLGNCTPDCVPPVKKTTARTQMTEITNEAGNEELKVFPNPSNGRFTLLLNNYKPGKTQINVLDVKGVSVETRIIESVRGIQKVTFNLGNLSTGMYMIKVLNDDGIKAIPIVITR